MAMPDFEAIYAGEPAVSGVAEVPWNLGEPQPVVAALIESGEVRSPVLDAGCGVGVTTRVLAERGHEVVGIDASASAVARAREDLDRAGLVAELAVADLTALTGYDGRFATVIDSAVFHALQADRRPSYVRALARACRSGAELHVLVFTDDAELPPAADYVNGVTEGQLRDLVGAEFVVDAVEPSTIAALLPRDVAPAAGRDEHDRAVLSALRLRAHRP